jgi:acyl-coenzyme A thioesterase 13
MATVPEHFVPAVDTDPAEDHIGPFYLWREEGADIAFCETGIITSERHTNNLGNVHGGVLMTFADFTLCAVGKTGSGDLAIVTVSMTTQFLKGTKAGGWLHGYGAVSRRTGSLVFVDGRLCDGDDLLVTFSGVGKRIRAG